MIVGNPHLVFEAIGRALRHLLLTETRKATGINLGTNEMGNGKKIWFRRMPERRRQLGGGKVRKSGFKQEMGR